jgi:hypothetical protein
MTLFWKCEICKTMVPIKDITLHKRNNSHKSRLILINLLDNMMKKIYNNEYDDNEIEKLLNIYIVNPFNNDVNY